jgi:hypothetical protein
MVQHRRVLLERVQLVEVRIGVVVLEVVVSVRPGIHHRIEPAVVVLMVRVMVLLMSHLRVQML